MEIIALFFLELFLLFLLSRTLQKKLSHFIFLLTRSIKMTVGFLAFIFFPGTLIHELAHLVMAHLLFVPVGKMELLPKLEGNSVKLGSVAIGRTDPFRRFLIGIAPFIVGTAVILTALWFVDTKDSWQDILMTAGILYVLFEIGNTMFSSKKDLEGVSLIVLFILSISVTLYILGLRVNLSDIQNLLNTKTVHLFYQGSIYLLFPLVLDLLLITMLSLSNRLLKNS